MCRAPDGLLSALQAAEANAQVRQQAILLAHRKHRFVAAKLNKDAHSRR